MLKSTSMKSRIIVIALGIALGYLAKLLITNDSLDDVRTPVSKAQTIFHKVNL